MAYDSASNAQAARKRDQESGGRDMLQSDKELISALRTLAKAMDEMSSGCGHNTADRLRAAADRIIQLAQANHDIRHM